jgi:tetratricopeptide (TPR) repeat protein
MMTTDALGHSLTGASRAAATLYDTALRQFQCYRDDPVATIDEALADSPAFVMGHVLRAWLHLLGTEPSGVPVAREALTAALSQHSNEREAGHLKAISQLIDGQWHAAARTLEDVSVAYPHDALALQAGHLLDFCVGDSRMLRDRIARALPAWARSMPGYHALLGMHAFGLEETGLYARAEAAGRQAIEMQRQDAWAWHAVAHVMEMQDRVDEGVAWLTRDAAAWSENNFFAVHNWWHLALHHLERGETARVLELFDGPIFGHGPTLALDLVDASALLWRLELAGAQVGTRWVGVAEAWAPFADEAHYTFNDVHAGMAFARAGRADLLERLRETQARAQRQPGDNAGFTAQVGAPLLEALVAFAQGQEGQAIERLRQVRPIAHRFGGSHAQRDLIDWTLAEAAIRSGDAVLARALSAERAQLKPSRASAAAMVRRAMTMAPQARAAA